MAAPGAITGPSLLGLIQPNAGVAAPFSIPLTDDRRAAQLTARRDSAVLTLSREATALAPWREVEGPRG